jgi:hypothetical protein
MVDSCMLRTGGQGGAVQIGAGVKDGGVLKESRRWWWCPGHRDDNGWKFLEILLSVGR